MGFVVGLFVFVEGDVDVVHAAVRFDDLQDLVGVFFAERIEKGAHRFIDRGFLIGV